MKKVLSVFLSVIMLLSIIIGIDLTAYAEIAISEEGKCGDNITYKLMYSTSTYSHWLEIEGYGDMYDYESSSESPFYRFRKNKLDSIKFIGDITSIGDYSFYGYEFQFSVSLPKTLERIGKHAFDSSKITAAFFCDNVSIIDDYAFAATPFLYYSGSSKKLKYIGNYAFAGTQAWGTDKFTSFNFPDGLETIGVNAFAGRDLTSVNIPDSVTTLGSGAFSYCKNLTSVRIGNGITEIPENAFYGCISSTGKKISNVIIPTSVKKIGFGAFGNAGYSCILNSQTVHYLGTVEQWEEIEKDEGYAAYLSKSIHLIIIKNQKAPTCTEDGYTGDEYCTVHAQYIDLLKFGKPIEKLGGEHNYRISETKPTCSKAGKKVYNCTRCGDSYTESIDKLAHTIIRDKSVAASCTESGLTAGSHCSVCNTVIKAQQTVPATGHSYDASKVTKAATCTANGVKTYTCTKCKATKTEAIKVTGHKAVTDKSIATTCIKAGKTEGSHCSVCNAVITAQKTIPATGHSYDEGKITKAATCTAAGVKTYTCTKCKATKTEAIKATGHKAVTDKAVAATCTKAGKTAGSHCSVCNAVITAQKAIPATGHKAVTDKAVAATCTKAGKTAGSHCSVCNTVIKAQQAVPATGHSYDAGKVTKAATATTTGVKTYTCTKCKATKAETIKATGLKTPVLKAAVNANGTIKLSWGKVAEAEKYELYIKQADGSYKLMKTTTGTSFTTAFATYGKQFTYKMRAVTGNTKSAYSAAVNATNTKKLQTPTMKVAVNANGTFKLSWNKVAGATSYQLYIKQADGSYKLMKTTNATSFTTAFATYGKQFTYKMRAVTSKNSSATSAYSSAVNAKNTKKLQTPSLKVTVNKNGSFKLSWGKVTGATSYQIYMKQANGSYKLIKTTSSTSFTTAVAAKGRTYSYKVRAVTSKNKNATSNYSNVVSAKRK